MFSTMDFVDMDGNNPRPARKAVVEQLIAEGVEYIFGNPGTIEQGLIDEIEQSVLKYILILQEAAAVGIADGYARASQRLGVLQLHTGVGLGNGIGMLYEATRGGTPLLVLVGEAGLKYDAFDAQMAVDLVSMAKPVTKHVERVLHPESTLRVLRRAIQIALTPPTGPVVVVLPADLLDLDTSEPVVKATIPITQTKPDDVVLINAAELLKAPGRHIIIVGDGVARSGAQNEIAYIAEILNADIYGANDSEVNVNYANPRYKGQLGHMFGHHSTTLLHDAATVLIVGTYIFPEVYPNLVTPFSPQTHIVHIDSDVRSIGKNHPITLGILADPKLCLHQIINILKEDNPVNPPQELTPSLPELLTTSSYEAVVRAIAVHAPDTVIFDEALTNSPQLLRYFYPRKPESYLLTRGGSLGVGIPGGVGAKLADPNRTVIAFTGDGGAMYTPQALWTAHRYGIAAKFIVCQNHRYHLLDNNIEEYWQENHITAHQYPSSFDLSPPIDFVALAHSMGVKAEHVTYHNTADQAVQRMLNHNGPYLLAALV